MGKAERVKGMRWQREFARLARHAFGCDAHSGAQARNGGDDPDVVGVPGYWPECKHHARGVNVFAALAQAARDSHGSDATPIAVCKADRKKPLVAMYLDDWLELASFAHRESGHSNRGMLRFSVPGCDDE